MKFKITGKSIKELLEEYGTGSSGFYQQSWYKKEKFFDEKPEAGEYDIDFGNKLTNLEYKEQLKRLANGYEVIHPAVLCEAVLSHYEETGKRLLEDTYSRTNTLDSDGNRVSVGSFDSDGLRVGSWSDGDRCDNIGLSATRKLDTGTLDNLNPLESLTLESAIKIVKEKGYKIYKEI